MFNFIRLQLKLKWGLNRNNSKINAIVTSLIALLAVVVALALVAGLSFVLKMSISVSAKELSVLYLTIIMIGLTVVAIGMQINRLYHPGDLNITARFPLSSTKMFISCLILNYIDLTIYSLILLLPIMIAFGIAMKCITVAFVFGIILAAILLPIVPFALSIFIAIPIMYLSTLLKRQNVIKIILFIILLVGLFVAYYYVLNVLAKFFIHRNWEEGTLEIWQNLISSLNGYYNPAYYISNIIFFNKFWLGFGATLGFGVLVIGLGILVAKVVYTKIRTKVLDGGSDVYKRYSKLDGNKSGVAILKHTIKEIIQTKTYSFFYLGVAISTPVMVFFCNRLVGMVGTAQMGGGINFGVSMLVVSVFMAMISSYAATILSIEGKNFYITKMIPVNYRKQLLVKGVVNVVVSLGALLISIIVLAALKFVNATELIVLAVSQTLFVVGIVFNGVNLNLVNPNLKPKANGEAEEINVTIMLVIGLLIAALFGIASIVLPRVMENYKAVTYLIIIIAAAIYSLVNVLVFWFTANKKYRKIEA